jgi:hypothetical protein
MAQGSREAHGKFPLLRMLARMYCTYLNHMVGEVSPVSVREGLSSPCIRVPVSSLFCIYYLIYVIYYLLYSSSRPEINMRPYTFRRTLSNRTLESRQFDNRGRQSSQHHDCDARGLNLKKYCTFCIVEVLGEGNS